MPPTRIGRLPDSTSASISACARSANSATLNSCSIETEEDFRQTLEVVDEVGYDGAFTFVYSPRRGTEAAGMPDQVPHEVKRERMERLVEAVQRRARERSARFVGRRMEVLVEGPSRTDPARLRGRTRHNKTVNFTGLCRPGELVDVEITSATSTTLAGEQTLLSAVV